MAKYKLVEKKTDTGGKGYNLTLNGLTKGEIMALIFDTHSGSGAVSQDVFAYVSNAICELGDSELKEYVERVKRSSALSSINKVGF